MTMKNVLSFRMGWSNKDAKDKTRYCGHFVKLCLTSCGAMSAFTHWKHLLLLSYYQSSMFMVWYVCNLNCVNAEFHSVPTVLFILVEKKNLITIYFSNIRYLFIYVFVCLFIYVPEDDWSIIQFGCCLDIMYRQIHYITCSHLSFVLWNVWLKHSWCFKWRRV